MKPITTALLVTIAFIAMATPTPAQSWCPKTETVTGPQVKARMGSWKRQTKVDVQEALYNPPPGCFIRNCRARVHSSFGLTSYSVSGVAAGSSFLTKQKLQETYEWAFDLAADLAASVGDEELTAELQVELQEQMAQHLQYLYEVRSSHQACRLHAEARGRGTFVDKGSSVVLTADIDLCCGVEELQDQQQLQRNLRRKIEEAVRNRPTTANWTPWLNRDHPSGTGDFETLRDFRKSGQACDQPLAVQCRVRGSDRVFGTSTAIGGEQVVCEPTVGAVCDNRRQPRGVRCSDYEVRFSCR